MEFVKRWALHKIFIGVIVGWSSTVYADLVVIVDQSSTFEHVASDDVKRIFLGKKKTLKGLPVIPIDQREGSRHRDIFYETVVKMSDAQIKSYWSRLIFTGKGQAPQAVANDGEVKAMIKDNPNMIGYVDESEVDNQFRIVYRVDR